MRFAFTEDQLAFRDAFRDLLANSCRPEDVRAAWEGEPHDQLWTSLAGMGVLGMLAPEEAGGLGLTDVDMVLILEESGRAAMPGPIVEHAGVGVPLLAGAGRADQAVDAAAGRVLVTFAERPERVGWGAQADVVLVASTAGGDVVAVPRSAFISVERLACVDHSRRDVALRWTAGEVLVGADAGLAMDRATLGSAAQLCGVAARLIEMTAAYVRERRQFGVQVGSFQAVKHHLANALLRLEYARPSVYRAAHSIAAGSPSRRRDVAMAKVMANRAGDLAGRVALQCHGAIGYTWEHDLHLWLKRAWVLERAWGETAQHRALVSDAILGPL